MLHPKDFKKMYDCNETTLWRAERVIKSVKINITQNDIIFEHLWTSTFRKITNTSYETKPNYSLAIRNVNELVRFVILIFIQHKLKFCTRLLFDSCENTFTYVNRITNMSKEKPLYWWHKRRKTTLNNVVSRFVPATVVAVVDRVTVKNTSTALKIYD